MRIVLGAGAVGLCITARLRRAEIPVLLVTRTPSAARALEAQGIEVEDPATGETWTVSVQVRTGLEAAAAEIGAGPVLVCVRAGDTRQVAEELARVAPKATAASVQNDLGNEAELARHLPRVLGVVFRQTCTRRNAREVAFTGAGRVVVGAHPEGRGRDVEELAGDFFQAGFEVGISERIAEDKLLKLFVNLMSAPNALVRREDHTTPAFVEVKVRLLEEAQAVLEAAGLVARSCDGRDRSVSEEIVAQRTALRRGASARPIPLYNQVWSALRQAAPLEADRYHRFFLDLAGQHRLPAPVNARVLEVLSQTYEEGRGPESVAAEDLLSGLR